MTRSLASTFILAQLIRRGVPIENYSIPEWRWYLLYRCETSIHGVEVPQSYLIFNFADLTRYICVLSNFKVFLYFGSSYKITIKEIYKIWHPLS